MKQKQHITTSAFISEDLINDVLVITLMPGTRTLLEMQGNGELVSRLLRERPRPLIAELTNVTMLPQIERDIFAMMPFEFITALAVVYSSTSLKSIPVLFESVAPLPFPAGLFQDIPTALRWVHSLEKQEGKIPLIRRAS